MSNRVAIIEMTGLSGQRRLRVARMPAASHWTRFGLNGESGVVSGGHGHVVASATVVVFRADLTRRYPQSRFVAAA